MALCASAAFAAAQAADASAAPTTELETVVVTAERREENVQNVPAAITAYSGERLTQLGVKSTKDLTSVTPALNFTQSGFSPQPTIRGIGTRGVGIGDESEVPVYIDGIYQPFLLNTVFDLNNVERVEVLKGPQATLYGRNSMGGAINIVTDTPQTDLKYQAGVTYGSFNEHDGQFYVTDGLPGGIAADLSVLYAKDDGYIHNIVSNITTGGIENINIRSKILVPITDNIDVTFVGSHLSKTDHLEQAIAPLNGNDLAVRYVPEPPIPTAPYVIAIDHGDISTDSQQWTGAVLGTARFGSFEIHTVSSYQSNDMKQPYQDTDATAAPLATFFINYNDESFYNEIYAISTNESPLQWIAGAVYYNDNYFGLTSSATTSPTTLAKTLSTTSATQTAQSYAGYLQGTYAFSPQWLLTVGGRLTREKRGINNASVTYAATAPIVPAPGTSTGHVVYTDFTPSATLQWQPTEDWNVYAKAGKGFKSGLFNATALNAPPVKPEYLTQYEIGAKTQPLPWLRVNLAIYHTDYKNLQVSVRNIVTNTTFLENAAAATLTGGELEVDVVPTSDLTLSAGLSLLHGKYTSYQNASVTLPVTSHDPTPSTTCTMGTGVLLGGNRSAFCDATGHQIIRAPSVSLNLAGDYSHDFGDPGALRLTTNGTFQGANYLDPIGRLRYPAYWLLNAEAAWVFPSGNVQVALWGKNLTGSVYQIELSTSSNGDFNTWGAPRSVGIRFDYFSN